MNEIFYFKFITWNKLFFGKKWISLIDIKIKILPYLFKKELNKNKEVRKFNLDQINLIKKLIFKLFKFFFFN
jgi:hypothetical protein